MRGRARVPAAEDDGALVVFAHQRKKPAGLRDTKGLRMLSLFVVSSGDVCGKKTNPCGEDAVCNQTNVYGICQCKAGFQRSQKSGQCEGATFTFTSPMNLPPGLKRELRNCSFWKF